MLYDAMRDKDVFIILEFTCLCFNTQMISIERPVCDHGYRLVMLQSENAGDKAFLWSFSYWVTSLLVNI